MDGFDLDFDCDGDGLGFGWVFPALVVGKLITKAFDSEARPQVFVPPAPAQPQAATAQCQHCRGLFQASFAFCPHCGQKVGPVECEYCGQTLTAQMRYCVHCGGPAPKARRT